MFAASLVVIGLLFSFGSIRAGAQTERSKIEALIDQYQSGDAADAIRALIQLAYQGNVAAQFNLGVISLDRGDDSIAAKEARFWFERAAEEGDIGAQFNMGMLLLNSSDLEALEAASIWLERAAEGGNRSAQVNVGILSLWGPDFPLTKTAGRQWLEIAMDDGDGSAVKVLALGEDPAVAGSALEFLYPMDKTLRAEVSRGESRVKRDAAPIFALPTGRQEPIDTLAENTPVEVLKKSNGWINVRPERGLPLWISAEIVEVSGDKATVSVLETGVYVAPHLDPEVYKVGSATKGETFTVLKQRQGWLLVEGPRRFTGWMREEDVDVRVRSVLVDETGSSQGVVQNQQSGTVLQGDDGGQGHVAGSTNPSLIADLRIKQVSKTTTIYSEKHLASGALGVVQGATEVFVGAEEDGFSFGKDIPSSGWIYAKLVTTGNESAFVNFPGARVRTKPDLGGGIITLFQVGREVDILEHAGNWYRIALDDVDGWIQTEFIANLQSVVRNESPDRVPEDGKNLDTAVTEAQETEFDIDHAIRIPEDSVLYVDDSNESASVGRLMTGLQIGKPKNGRQMVQVPIAVKTYGWIYASLVTQSGSSGTVKNNGVRVRYDPDTSKENIIRTFDKDETVTIIERVDDWYRIALGAQRGWISINP